VSAASPALGTALRPVERLFVVAIALSAFLLFLIQPIIAKQLLPWFGGSSAVWITCAGSRAGATLNKHSSSKHIKPDLITAW